jgi:hypothetical protein
LIVDSYKFLPRSFRPLYEGRGPFPGEEKPVWQPFEKRLADARIALLTSAGMYVKASHAPFDVAYEQTHPDWGDPTWRSIPATAGPGQIGVAHLHINDEDILADPEIALPMRGLSGLAAEGVVGGTVDNHVALMGFQDRRLKDWHRKTAPEVAAHLREQGADALILAPA